MNPLQKHPWLVRLTLLVLVLAVGRPSIGQPVDLPTRLSFDEARLIFLDRNPDLKAARARAEQRGHEASIPALWPNPSFAFQRNQTRPPGGGFGTESTLAFQQPLRYPAEHAALRSAAQEHTTAAMARYEEVAAELYEVLRTRYASLTAAERRFEAHEIAVEAIRRAVQIGEIRHQEGDISPFELARLRVALATYEDDLEAARIELRDARIELAYFLTPQAHVRHHASEETELTASDALAYNPLTVDYDQLVERALARRGLLSAAEADHRSREHLVRSEQWNRLPDLGVTAGYRGETQPGVRAPGFTIGLQIGLPLFHQNQPMVLAARAAATASSHDAARARREVELDVHDAYEHLLSYQQRISRIANEILAQSGRLLEDALYVYEEGEIELVGLLDAVEAARTAQLLETDLVVQHHFSLYALERAIGIGPHDASPLEQTP